MTLDEWVEQHRADLKREEPSGAVVADLAMVADREIGDAETVRSDDGGLEHAFAACLAIAGAALAASGYRVRHGAPAHHYLLIDSLEHTLELAPAEVQELQDYRKKRGRSMYETVGLVTATEARSSRAAARRLRERLASWLAQKHPDLTDG